MGADDYNVPVAARDHTYLRRFGRVHPLGNNLNMNEACILVENGLGATPSFWCRMERNDYRALYIDASDPIRNPRVSALEDWGENVDADHVAARGMMRAMKLCGWLIRIHPCWCEVNRRGGAGREKLAGGSRHTAEDEVGRKTGGVIFAGDLQLLKMMGMNPGTGLQPERGNW